MSVIRDLTKQKHKQFLAQMLALRIRASMSNYLKSDPDHAIAHANAAFDEANRAEYERLPVML